MRIPNKIERDWDDGIETVRAPIVKTKMAIEGMDAFALRKLNPQEFNAQELKYLYNRFDNVLRDFNIYFLENAIGEKFGYPDHLHNIGQQLLKRHRFNLFVAPRGFSKSTVISCGFVLHETVYMRKNFIVIVSETTDIASDFTETIRHEFEQNFKLKMFYGDFQSKRIEGDSTEKWTVADLICRRNITPKDSDIPKYFYTRIRARGNGQQIRGKKHRHQRPDLLIFDDMESRNNTDTEHQRVKTTKWFNRDAIKIMDYYDEITGKGQVVVAGTIVHPESRLNNLYKSVLNKIANGKIPQWIHQFYKAADNPKDCLDPIWPERFPTNKLLQEKEISIENNDLAGFVQEMFNQPISDDERKFHPSYFIKRYPPVEIENYYGNLTLTMNKRRYPVRLSVGMDLGGYGKESDYTSIVVLGNIWDSQLNINRGLVLEVYNERWTPSEVIEMMFEISHRYSAYDDRTNTRTHFIPWTVETNAFQDLLYFFLYQEMTRRKDFSIDIAHEDHESQSKDARIMSMHPVFKSQFYEFREDQQWVIQRWIDYGLASDMHDDMEDAFQKAHRNLEHPYEYHYEQIEKIPSIHVVEPPKLIEGSWAAL